MTTTRIVAVLCAANNSVYKQLDGVDVYDQARDARTFAGRMPIVAHPPCRAWSAYCRHQAKPLPGERDLAPYSVVWLEKCGGVLEHPAHSTLWATLGLPRPGERALNGMWSMKVKQSWWGDIRSKNTWLLFSGISAAELPEVPFCLHDPSGDRKRWSTMSKHQRASTPRLLAEWLVEVARRSKV